jgi:tRNA (cmo5U34)-methyltransferase
MTAVNEWASASHAGAYLGRADVPHRSEGESLLWELLPPRVERVLDLGTGDGRLLARVRERRLEASGVAVDFSPTMLAAARERFQSDHDVSVVEHNLDYPLPELGTFDVVVSSFAIHHLVPERQRALYGEVFERLRPGGVFANVEHVASTTERRHEEFLSAIGSSPEQDDPSNKLVPVADHLSWLDGLGFADAECLWKWRELAVVTGTKPGR